MCAKLRCMAWIYSIQKSELQLFSDKVDCILFYWIRNWGNIEFVVLPKIHTKFWIRTSLLNLNSNERNKANIYNECWLYIRAQRSFWIETMIKKLLILSKLVCMRAGVLDIREVLKLGLTVECRQLQLPNKFANTEAVSFNLLLNSFFLI